MWHNNVGHWVVNPVAGTHVAAALGGDVMRTKLGDFACPQHKTEWEEITQTDFKVSSAPCCDRIYWNKDGETELFIATDDINEEYPIYQSNQHSNIFMWWMWHGSIGHWVVNTTPGKHGKYDVLQ